MAAKAATSYVCPRTSFFTRRCVLDDLEQSADLEGATDDGSRAELQAERLSQLTRPFIRIEEHSQDRRVDEVRRGEIGDDEMVPPDQRVEELSDLVPRREVVLAREDDDRRAGSRLLDLNVFEGGCQDGPPSE